MSDLLPVLVADLANESAREALIEVARQKGQVWVPLVTPPANASRHLLEIYTPDAEEPLRLYAEPVGPPGPKGFPLRLALPDHEEGVPAVAVAPAEERDKRRLDTPTVFVRKSTNEPRVSPALNAELAGDAAAPISGEGDSLVGRTLAGGKLELEALIGRGALGAVYRARHRQLFVPVAVKVLHEDFQHDVDFARRFYAEALAASRLDHPNLVRVFDFGQEPDGRLYLSMELVDGPSLRQLVASGEPLDARRIAEIMLQVCAGLGHAHARGLVHRDVRPENILLVQGQDDDGNPREVVKVQDFGIALLRAKGAEARQEKVRATPEYMSPEQCRGEELDARSDVYACGVILYELATGHVPFKSDRPIVVVNRHLSMTPPLVAEQRADVDPRLERIVQRALKKSRAERHADMRELRADLKTLLARPSAADVVFDLEREAARVASSLPPATMSVPPPAAVPSFPPAQSFSIPPDAPVPSVVPPTTGYAFEEIQRAVPVRTSSRPAPATPSAPPEPRIPSPAPPPRPSTAPAWLEIRDEGMAKFLGGMSEVKSEELADVLATDPVRWLGKLTGERDIRTFTAMLKELELAVRTLASRADAKALWAVSSTLHGLATEGTQGPGSRGSRAGLMMRFFTEPGTLAPIAERMLARDDDAREAAKTLIVRAGVAGAYALYGARVKLAVRPEARAPFVTTMRALGAAAWPVIRAALEKIPDAALVGEHKIAALLAEDLLLSVPVVQDEAAGHVVLKYVRSKVPALCRAAAVALAKLWAERATPVLLGLFGDVADPGVRAAALLGLRHVGAVDEHVVPRLARVVRHAEPSTQELDLAVVGALEAATQAAKPLALQLLAEVVGDPHAGDVVVLAAARALLARAKREAIPLISARADQSPEPLRSQLLVLTS